MDDWFDNLNGVITKKTEQHFLPHQETLNHNNGIMKQTRWDDSSKVHKSQSKKKILYYISMNLNKLFKITW